MAKIIIELNTDAGDTLEKALAAISRNNMDAIYENLTRPNSLLTVPKDDPDAAHIPAAVIAPEEPTAPVDELLEASKLGPMDGDRKRGHGRAPSKRRTNAQIAEDNRWFAYLETIKTNGEAALSIADVDQPSVEQNVAEPETDIVFGEGDPEAPPSDPEVAAQDAADEAAESAKTAEAPRTTLQRAIAAYVKKFGAAVATTEMQKIIGKPSRDLTDAEIPDAIARLTAAMGVEPESAAKFTPVETAAPIDPASVTIENVREAMMAYGVKYDGTSNPKKMTFTAEDMPWVLQHTFSIGVVSPERIPKNEKHGYHKALLAIRDAIEKNPRNRMLKAFRG